MSSLRYRLTTTGSETQTPRMLHCQFSESELCCSCYTASGQSRLLSGGSVLIPLLPFSLSNFRNPRRGVSSWSQSINRPFRRNRMGRLPSMPGIYLLSIPQWYRRRYMNSSLLFPSKSLPLKSLSFSLAQASQMSLL
jgi:hypothetical protein